MTHIRIYLVVLIILVTSWMPLGCSGSGGGGGASLDGVPVVRVRLVSNADSVEMAAIEPAVFRSTGENLPRRLSFPDSAAPVAIKLDAGGWRVGSVSLAPGELLVRQEVPGTVHINGRRYHGEYRLVPTGDGKFDVINHVDVESYLQGVVPRELFRDWEPEAYRAQAIVARTYALYEVRTNPTANRHWDLWPDTRSQVYGGINDESGKGNEAVQATRGVVAAHGPQGGERIFKAYFSACCGGISQNVTDAFGTTYTPVLGDRQVGRLCKISPRYNWPAVTVSKAELTRRIRAWGASRNHPVQSLQKLDRIDVAYVNRFGRPVRFMIVDASGQRYSLGSEETRWACNHERGQSPQLFSSFFKPVNQPSEIIFSEGHGHGHGVGMCQWCAQALALQGVPSEDIVRFSYPGSVLVRAY